MSTPATLAQSILARTEGLASEWGAQRQERQRRRELHRVDFDRLREAGVHLAGVLAEDGGLWQDVARSSRPVCEVLRVLAHGDSSVALVTSMHPSVLSFWLATPTAAPATAATWTAQRQWASQTARDGAWWGTITSEPGSGGDTRRTRTTATPDGDGDRYRLTGQKHFGSGSGITDFMLTSAQPEGEDQFDWFFIDVRGVPWDGSAGLKLIAPWDGHGMVATQSHGMQFERLPAVRFAGRHDPVALTPVGFVPCAFTAVIVGIVEVAVDTARRLLARRRGSLSAYDRVEWTRAEMDAWLIQQAYAGMLAALEAGDERARSSLLGKEAVAELAEAVLRRLCRVMGGGSYSRYSPFGWWFEDVRALGWLRPPWGLAFETLFEGSWPAEPDAPAPGGGSR
ncbi:MAG: acyl-CoA/acyl-ACP dehydrogenase [Chloroflexi bacterium]|nr:acyl-CoA/acyl-ACP dehydrogenase [Chloroflexota bacterium]